MEDIFATLNFRGRGISINGEYISHLQVADKFRNGRSAVTYIYDAVCNSLRMNMDRTMVLFKEHTSILLELIAIHDTACVPLT